MQVSPLARAMAMSPTLSLLLLSAEIESPLQRLHRYADADPVEPVECFNACSCLECRWRRVCFIFFSLTRSPVPFKDCSARAESQLRRSYAQRHPSLNFARQSLRFTVCYSVAFHVSVKHLVETGKKNVDITSRHHCSSSLLVSQ